MLVGRSLQCAQLDRLLDLAVREVVERQRRQRVDADRVAAERASQEQPDDASADRVRLEAPDIVKVD